MTINDPEGRYGKSETRQTVAPDGRIVSYLARRFVPEPTTMTIAATIATEPGDRIDNFSAKTMGVATAWWRIADANRVIHPETLENPVGQRLAIPLPEVER